jgi:hypothetical protein
VLSQQLALLQIRRGHIRVVVNCNDPNNTTSANLEDVGDKGSKFLVFLSLYFPTMSFYLPIIAQYEFVFSMLLNVEDNYQLTKIRQD